VQPRWRGHPQRAAGPGGGERGAHLADDLVFAQDDGVEPGGHGGQPVEGVEAAQVVRRAAAAVSEPVSFEALAAHDDRIGRVSAFDVRAHGRHLGRAERDGAPGATAKIGQGVGQAHKVD